MNVDTYWIEKLTPLIERDQVIQDVLMGKGVLEDTYHPELEKAQLLNAQKLKRMIETKGFPVLSNAGEKGVHLSWLIIQHAISLPDFMRESLIQIRLAVSQEDYPKELLAYTEDKICFLEGRRQLFGTNLEWEEGELKATPIEDPKFVDERRKAFGLPPIAEVLLQVTHTKPPKDPVKKALELKLWLLKVGWRV